MSLEEIGCCGAYCRNCRSYIRRQCRGCRLGYAEGERQLARARCRVKRCCISKGFISCADCPDFPLCAFTQAFYSRNGGKNDKYRQAILFIRRNGYDEFLAAAGCRNGTKVFEDS